MPNIVLIGLPDVSALRRVLAKLEAHNIPHYAWYEPDNDFGLTAIATAPIAGEQRKALANYRVYSASVAQIVNTEHSVLAEGSQVQNLPEAPIFTPVAQQASASASKAEGVCSSHTRSASGGSTAASAVRV